MRIVQKLLAAIGGLLALVLLFFALCHINPSISEQLNETFYAGANSATPVDLTVTLPEDSGVDTTKDTDTTFTTDIGIIPDVTYDYEPVDEANISVPSELLALEGYTPVEDIGKELTQNQAQTIVTSLGIGQTGSDLTFDALIYPYYHMLNESGQALYRQIYANTNALNSSFAPVVVCNTSQLKNAFTAVVNDHPELFWLDTTYTYQYASTGKICEIDLSFNYTARDAATLETSKTQFEAAAMDLVYKSRGQSGDYAIELNVHNNLLDQVIYDLNAPINQSAYSALINGRTVCAGYARAFQYVMQLLDIPCYYVTGYAGGNHAWNIIKLGDDYYNVDTTWDDTNPNTINYLNCSDAEFASTHSRRDLSVYLPACLGTVYGADIRQAEADALAAYLEEQAALEEAEKAEAERKAAEASAAEEKANQEAAAAIPRTIEQVGFSNSDVILDIDTYYEDCITHLLAASGNSVTFYNIVDNEDLWEDISEAYEEGDHMSIYMNRILAEKHLSNCNVNITGEVLADNSVLIKHVIQMN